MFSHISFSGIRAKSPTKAPWKKCACGDTSAKLNYDCSCTFCVTFKGKCPMSGTKSAFSSIQNRCESNILLR